MFHLKVAYWFTGAFSIIAFLCAIVAWGCSQLNVGAVSLITAIGSAAAFIQISILMVMLDSGGGYSEIPQTIVMHPRDDHDEDDED